MATEPHLVKFTSLEKRYGDGPLVLAELDLAVAKGDFLTLIGPSGCGKSTILKLVAGLSPASAGGLTVAGTTPVQARDRLGYVFQDATLLPWLTAMENVELPLKLRGKGMVERSDMARDRLAMVGLGEVGGYYPRQLSGGMKMRVSIARALALAPELLLLDEPFGALDEMTRNRLNEELLAMRAKTPFTAIFVTHSVSEAVFLSNRIVIMAAHPGRVHAEVKVEFPYPRRPELRNESFFQAKASEVSRLLHQVEEVVS